MLEKRFFKARSSLVNVLTCIGTSFFLCSHSIAMEETKDGLVSLGPTRFPFETLTEIEKKEFSSSFCWLLFYVPIFENNGFQTFILISLAFY